MPLNDQGFSLVDLPEISEEIFDSYERLPHDPYMGNGTRYKRFSQYRLSWDGAAWQFKLLPHRDYTAFKEFNPVGGGYKRSYEPIEVDFTELIRYAAQHLPLDSAEDWQINVHQNRTTASRELPGVLTPEGVHQDGHEFVMIAVLRRNAVTDGQTRLWKLGADEPFWSGVLEPRTAVLIDDRAVAHDVTDVQPAGEETGKRDIVIVAFSRWQERWYGDEHDQAALTEAASARN
ncbi:MAG TPA: 2OG-Fe dioxygenase family protein [Jatrophihabitans sp.]|uniref:2OG-Fe dioxygenase family protein n=1 Tax=Jatrophihabitans sp. TaxID=1932789 RepID=UPI002EE14CB4